MVKAKRIHVYEQQNKYLHIKIITSEMDIYLTSVYPFVQLVRN